MKLLDLFLAVIMCLAWATDYIVTKEILFTLGPIFSSALRFGIVGLFVLPFCRRIPPYLGTLTILSFVLVILTYGFGDIGIKLNTSVTVTNLIIETNVIVSVIFAAIFLKEKLFKKAIIGIVIAFAGVILVIIGNGFTVIEGVVTSNTENLLSLLSLILPVIAWPIYAVWSKKLENKLTPIEIIGWTGIIGLFIGIAVSMIFETGQLEVIQNMDLKLSLLLLYSGVGGIIIPHKIVHRLMRLYDVSKTMICSLMVPLVCALESYFFFNEKLSVTIIFGGAMLLYGVYLCNFAKKPEITTITSDDNDSLLDQHIIEEQLIIQKSEK